MLVNEVISAEGKLELWRMVSNSMWAALDAQARAEIAAKAERDSVRKPRKRSADAPKPKSVPVPPRAVPPPSKPSVTNAAGAQSKQLPPTQDSTPVQQSSSTAAGTPQDKPVNANAPAVSKPKPNLPLGGTLLARERGVVNDAV